MAGAEYLFVYGTLRRGFRGRMARWLSARGRYIGRAILPGRLYDIGRYPGFVPGTDAGGETVVGDLYLLPHPAPLLRKLDAFEGIGSGQSRPYEYIRRRLPVRCEGDSPVEAWVYLYNRSLAVRPLIPGGDYLKYRRGRRR